VENPPETKAERKRVAATLKVIRKDLNTVLSVVGIGEADPHTWLTERRDRLAHERGLDIAWVQDQIEQRQTAKNERNFAKADSLRDALSDQGIELLDKRMGTIWRLSDS